MISQNIIHCHSASVLCTTWWHWCRITVVRHPSMLTPSHSSHRHFLLDALDSGLQCSGAAGRLVLYSLHCLQQGCDVGHHYLTDKQNGKNLINLISRLQSIVDVFISWPVKTVRLHDACLSEAPNFLLIFESSAAKIWLIQILPLFVQGSCVFFCGSSIGQDYEVVIHQTQRQGAHSTHVQQEEVHSPQDLKLKPYRWFARFFSFSPSLTIACKACCHPDSMAHCTATDCETDIKKRLHNSRW